MRRILVAPLTAAAVATAVAAGPWVHAKEQPVDMQAVLVAAQVDPQRPDRATTPGSADDVETVERALHDAGLLDQRWVDGSFGSKTVAAYRAYQESLGYRGVDANGLPGATSLRRLGAHRFGVTHVVEPGQRVDYQGKTVNTRTKRMLAEASRLLGRRLVLDQGSYNPGGDPTSAGTHDGGGVVDVSVAGMTAAERTETTRVLRTVGFAAWHRTPDQGDWPHHIHAVAVNDPDLAGQAQAQVGDYYLGRNGLADHAPDDGPTVTPKRTWEEYQHQR